MATWLQSLGVPLLASNNATRRSNQIRTPMETGPDRRSLRSSISVTNGTVSFIWTAAQKANWEAYFTATLAHGTIAISDFPYPLVANTAGQFVRLDAESEAVEVPEGLFRVTIPYEAEGRAAA